MMFRYLYRDAGNYKAFGSIRLNGTLTDAEQSELLACLDGGEFFVAEQVGIPALYNVLFEESGGPTQDDHAWHTYEDLRDEAEMRADMVPWGEAVALLEAFREASKNWKPELSPNLFGSAPR